LALLVIVFDLDPFSRGKQGRNLGLAPGHHLFRSSPQSSKFIRIDVVALVLGEAIQEHCASAGPIDNQDAEPARSALALSSHALLDHATAEIGVHQPTLDTLNGFAQTILVNSLPAAETREALGSVDAHNPTPNL
jgi:hypothetical protein